MKCDSCQEKATVFYTQVADGKLKKFVLCEACAQAKGITDPEGMLMAEELLGAAPPAAQSVEPFQTISRETCSKCGFTLEDFRKVGRLGCPACYRAFSQEVGHRLPSMHKGVKHQGYLPEGLIKRQALHNELAVLGTRLEIAIGKEQFEEAAKLRDQIKALESEKEASKS